MANPWIACGPELTGSVYVLPLEGERAVVDPVREREEDGDAVAGRA